MHLSALVTCQCLVTAFQTPTLPVWLVAMSWFPTKNKASTGTFKLNTPAGQNKQELWFPNMCERSKSIIWNESLPISLPFPSGQIAHSMISVPDATATILSLSPREPAKTLALRATLSITQSSRGLVNTCCHPVDSLTLSTRNRRPV